MKDQSKLWNGRYQIRKEIGEGQFGKVYLARDIHKQNGEQDQKVAIKVIKCSDDKDNDDSFDDQNDDNYENLVF